MSKKNHNIYECLQVRMLLEQISDKWAILVLSYLAKGPARFNQIKKTLDGVSQKSLTQCLRKLERNGLISRTVIDGKVLGVEYGITELGESVNIPFTAVFEWIKESSPKVEKAQKKFDELYGN